MSNEEPIVNEEMFNFIMQMSNEYEPKMVKTLAIYLEKRGKTNIIPIAYSILSAMNICSFVNKMEGLFEQQQQFLDFKDQFYRNFSHDLNSFMKTKFEIEKVH